MGIDRNDAVSIFRNYYDHLGPVISLNTAEYSYRVNNNIFNVETEKGNYIFKFNESLNEFYGIDNSINKLEFISQVSSVLNDNGLNIERGVRSSENKYAYEYENGSARVFEYYKNREYSAHTDYRSILDHSKKLHQFPLEILEKNAGGKLDLLSAPYALESTIDKHDYILDKLKSESGYGWANLISNFNAVHDEALSMIDWNSGMPAGLTHMDLHPRNVLFGTGGDSLLIDMDYLRVGNPYLCLGLTFTRSAFFGKQEKTLQDIETYLSDTLEGYFGDYGQEQVINTLNGALYIEIEKIFRNLYRFYLTGKYRNYAEDVPTLHYPIFLLIKELIRKRVH